MREWLRFFFGTPARFVASGTILGAFIVWWLPGVVHRMGQQLVVELSPLLHLALSLAVLYFGLRFLGRAVFGGGGRRRRRR